MTIQTSFSFMNNMNHKNEGNGIGARCVELLGEGWSPKEVLAMVKSEFPLAQTSIKCVYWYNSKKKVAIAARRDELAALELGGVQ